ncbi:DUF6505 family protein [Pelagibius marinus]|uniref:DUF6505 family protein n=1 Tax=Pelagibius marinus TaxID=2762760 RepID=UPI001872D211|nr:DUF6505 family protein [Pelagibius marinus]
MTQTPTRLPRALRLDQSDLHVFERPCDVGEWAIPGSFAYAGLDPARLEGKAQIAFKSAWLGLTSFGHTTLVEVAEVGEADFFAAVERLARHIEEAYSAPSFGQALAAARQELEDAAGLCEHKLGTLLAIEREPRDEGFVERFRVIEPARAGDHAKIWEITPDTSEDDPADGV